MGWSGLTRYEVEAELLSRVDRCRATFERLRDESVEICEISHAALGSPDGILSAQRAVEMSRVLRLAQDNYMAALKDFSHFIISGTLPEDTGH